MWLMVKINWGLYTQLKSTVNSFIPPKETHRPETLIALNATWCKKKELHPDACMSKRTNFNYFSFSQLCRSLRFVRQTAVIHTQSST